MAAALLLSPAAWAQAADVGVRKLTPTYGPPKSADLRSAGRQTVKLKD